MKRCVLALGLAMWCANCGGDSDQDDQGANAHPNGTPNGGDGTPTGGSSGQPGGPGNENPSDGGINGDGGGNPSVPSGGGDPVGACDPNCTGTKMCNDATTCVCAPGWVASGSDCVAAPVSAPGTRTKAEVCARYAADTAKPSALWVPGTSGTCDPGTIPYDAQVAALRYLNFNRWMVGVGPVQVLPSMAKAEQECAKILNNSFSHSPDPSTPCYTADGAKACADSLIAGGSLLSQFDAYATESQQNLIHRRNVFAVGRAGIWAGASNGSAAMHYGGAYPALPSDPEIVAHPGPGFNLRSKSSFRWFVQKGTKTIPPVDARVYVKATNEPKPMKRVHHFTDFSSFDTDGWVAAVDVAYRVELVDDANAVVSTFETTFTDCP